MRWISRLLRRRPEPAPQRSETPRKTPGQQAAESALSRSRVDREQIEAHRPAVDYHAGYWRRERERNHFAELFRTAFGGRPN